MTFDPTQPFTVVSKATVPHFDPSKPFNKVTGPGLTDKELDTVLNRPRPAARMENTTAGGPQKLTPSPEAGRALGEELATEAQTPIHALPKFQIKPTDSKTMAVGKEAANLIVGIPEFLETPLGIATTPAGGVIPRTMAGIFGAFTLHNLGSTVLSTHRDWHKLSPPQRAAAVTDIAGDTLLAGLLARGATKGGENNVRNVNKQASVQPQRETGNAGGQTTETGGGNSVQPTTQSQTPAPQTPQAPVPAETDNGARPGENAPALPVLEPVDVVGKERKNLPEWAREEMERRGLDPNRPLNDIDIDDPKVQAAIKADPTLSQEEKEQVLKTGSARGRATRPYLAPRADGIPDILDAIQEEGGLKPPGEHAGPEYDGYGEAMIGPARLLRNTTAHHSVDSMMEALREHGYQFETPDHFWQAVKRAAQERQSLPAAAQRQAKTAAQDQQDFEEWSKGLELRDNAVWSGDTKLADVHQAKNGSNLLVPTAEAEALPSHYQEELINKFAAGTAANTSTTSKAATTPTAPEIDLDLGEELPWKEFQAAHNKNIKEAQKKIAGLRATLVKLKDPSVIADVENQIAMHESFIARDEAALNARAIKEEPKRIAVGTEEHAQELIAKHGSREKAITALEDDLKDTAPANKKEREAVGKYRKTLEILKGGSTANVKEVAGSAAKAKRTVVEKATDLIGAAELLKRARMLTEQEPGKERPEWARQRHEEIAMETAAQMTVDGTWSDAGPKPNISGVFDKDEAEAITYNAKKAKAAIHVLKLPKGWAIGVDTSHMQGNHHGHSYGISAYKLYPTRQDAINAGADEIIDEQKELLKRRTSVSTDKQREEMQKMIDWAQKLKKGTGAAAKPTTEEVIRAEDLNEGDTMTGSGRMGSGGKWKVTKKTGDSITVESENGQSMTRPIKGSKATIEKGSLQKAKTPVGGPLNPREQALIDKLPKTEAPEQEPAPLKEVKLSKSDDDAVAKYSMTNTMTPHAKVVLAFRSARSKFRGMGKWADLKGALARQQWQRARSELEQAQRDLANFHANEKLKPAVATSFKTAETGKPFQMRLMRGEGATESPYSEFVPQEPILGAGRWTTSSREYAETFVKNITEHDVSLNNPLVIRTDDEWRQLVKDAGWRYANPFGQDIAKTKADIQSLRRLLENRGFDGVVIDPSEDGDEAKVLWDVFGAQQAVEFTGGGRTAAMGGTPKSPARIAAEQSGMAMRERRQAGAGQTAAMGGSLGKSLDDEFPDEDEEGGSTTGLQAGKGAGAGGGIGGRPWFAGLRAAFNPMSFGDAAKDVATILRYAMGKRFQNEQRFDEAMGKYRAMFDRDTTPRGYKYDATAPLPSNWEVQRAIDSGDTAGLTPAERAFANLMHKMFAEAIAQIQKFKPDVLQDLYEHYFPRGWVKADGRDVDENFLGLIRAHRPWEGPKTFLKPRSLALWEDALNRGLMPKFDNPVDAVYAKLSEMWRFAGALEAHGMMKARGVRRFRYIFERAPDGWVPAAPDDPSTKVFAPPMVTIKEAFDEMLRVKTYELFKSLGVSQKRLESLGGGKRWGDAYSGYRTGKAPGQAGAGEEVRTKFGGPDFVFWHEFGHIMDFRFPDLRSTLGLDLAPNKIGPTRSSNDLVDKELRALADARLPLGQPGEVKYVDKKTGKVKTRGTAARNYVRKAEEKMAVVFQAYVHSPDLMRQLAPNVTSKFLRWLEKHPEVKVPLNDIRPSLKLGVGETKKMLAGPVLLGEWIMPEEAAQVLRNYLAPSVWGRSKTLSGIKRLGGIMSNVRLLSLFHGQMVSNDALASGLSLPLYDGMQALARKDPTLLKRAAGDLFLAPFRPALALAQGHRMLKELKAPGSSGSTLDQQLVRWAVEANLQTGHIDHVDNATRRWKQALFEAANTPGIAKAAPLWTAFYRTPLMVSHEMMRPVMEWFVPRMKYGLFAPMAMRVIRDNPGADEMTLRQLMGKAADSVEDRVGQVTYDNMFLSKAVKDSGQLALQAFGWHATKERMLWGSASDYFKAGAAMLKGQQPEITFRMAYLPAMVVTHAMIGATIMYVLTGQRPSSLLDYLFPRTGLVDQYGKPVRLAIADFMKDYLSEAQAAAAGPKATVDLWERRLLPVWNNLADMYRNRDFWNTRIFSERKFDQPEWQHLWDNFKEGMQYTVTGNAPFSVKGSERFQQNLGPHPTPAQEALAYAGPYLGFVPAPQALTQSPAEARAAQVMRDSMAPMSKDQEARAVATSQLVHDLRTGKINDAGQLQARERTAGIDPNTREGKMRLEELKKRVLWSPLQYQVSKLPLYEPGGEDALSVWDLMNEKEKRQTAPIYKDKILTVARGGGIDADTAVRLMKAVAPYLAIVPPKGQDQQTNGAPQSAMASGGQTY